MARLEKIYAIGLMVIFGLIVLHAPISVGLGVLFPKFDLLIKSWKEILMLLLVPLAIIIATHRRLWQDFLRDWLFCAIAGYAALHLVLSIWMYQGLATMAGLAIDLRYVLFFSLVYVLIKALPQYRPQMMIVGIIGAVIVVGFATIQLFLPADVLVSVGYGKDTIAPYLTVDKNPDYIRVNSTLRGPNPLGAYATMVLGLLTAAWMRGKIIGKKLMIGAIILAALASVALWISYSRSSLVAGMVTLLVVFLVVLRRKASRLGWIMAAVAVFIFAGAFVAAKDTSIVSNVLLHENLEGGSSTSSNEQHAQSIIYGFDSALRQPLGAGVGSTGSASLHGNAPLIIENQYLFIAHETGWLGLGLFVYLFGLVLARLWKNRSDWLALGVFASGLGLGLIGALLPVWVDDTVSIVWWGLAAIALIGGVSERKSTKQKTKRTA